MFIKRKSLTLLLILCFLTNTLGIPAFAGSMAMPSFYQPPLLKYLSINSANPYNYFNFLLDRGQGVPYSKLDSEANKAVNYFFLGLTLKEDSFWVNLKPQEPNRMTSEELAKTDMGKVLLNQDLLLKKDVAKYLHPDNFRGKEFWERLYNAVGKVNAKNMSFDSYNRVWVVPDKAVAVETEDGVLITEAKLKVLLEKEYQDSGSPINNKLPTTNYIDKITQNLMKELIIPELTFDVNNSPAYAPLRQVYHSLILAQYYKNKYRSQNSVYSGIINTNQTKSLESQYPWSKQKIWQDYLKSYKQGEYKVKSSLSGLNRMYFSGGIVFASSGINSLACLTIFKPGSPLSNAEFNSSSPLPNIPLFMDTRSTSERPLGKAITSIYSAASSPGPSSSSIKELSIERAQAAIRSAHSQLVDQLGKAVHDHPKLETESEHLSQALDVLGNLSTWLSEIKDKKVALDELIGKLDEFTEETNNKENVNKTLQNVLDFSSDKIDAYSQLNSQTQSSSISPAITQVGKDDERTANTILLAIRDIPAGARISEKLRLLKINLDYTPLPNAFTKPQNLSIDWQYKQKIIPYSDMYHKKGDNLFFVKTDDGIFKVTWEANRSPETITEIPLLFDAEIISQEDFDKVPQISNSIQQAGLDGLKIPVTRKVFYSSDERKADNILKGILEITDDAKLSSELRLLKYGLKPQYDADIPPVIMSWFYKNTKISYQRNMRITDDDLVLFIDIKDEGVFKISIIIRNGEFRVKAERISREASPFASSAIGKEAKNSESSPSKIAKLSQQLAETNKKLKKTKKKLKGLEQGLQGKVDPGSVNFITNIIREIKKLEAEKEKYASRLENLKKERTETLPSSISISNLRVAFPVKRMGITYIQENIAALEKIFKHVTREPSSDTEIIVIPIADSHAIGQYRRDFPNAKIIILSYFFDSFAEDADFIAGLEIDGAVILKKIETVYGHGEIIARAYQGLEDDKEDKDYTLYNFNLGNSVSSSIINLKQILPSALNDGPVTLAEIMKDFSKQDGLKDFSKKEIQKQLNLMVEEGTALMINPNDTTEARTRETIEELDTTIENIRGDMRGMAGIEEKGDDYEQVGKKLTELKKKRETILEAANNVGNKEWQRQREIMRLNKLEASLDWGIIDMRSMLQEEWTKDKETLGKKIKESESQLERISRKLQELRSPRYVLANSPQVLSSSINISKKSGYTLSNRKSISSSIKKQSKDEIFKKVKTLLAENFFLNEEDIELTTSLEGDLGLDSLELLEVMSRIEKEFEIKDFNIEYGDTIVADVVNEIEEQLTTSSSIKKWTMGSIIKKVKEMVGDELGLDKKEIQAMTLETDIYEDLGADSLEFTDLIQQLASFFHINDNDILTVKNMTIRNLANFINKKLKSSNLSATMGLVQASSSIGGIDLNKIKVNIEQARNLAPQDKSKAAAKLKTLYAVDALMNKKWEGLAYLYLQEILLLAENNLIKEFDEEDKVKLAWVGNTLKEKGYINDSKTLALISKLKGN